jgi:hypothetical protein
MKTIFRLILGFFACVTLSHAQVTTTNLLVNPGAETGDLTGWPIGGSSNPFLGDPANSLGDGFPTHSGAYYFVGGHGSYGSLSQLVSLSGLQGVSTADIDSGNVAAAISFWEQGLNQGALSDDASVTLVFLDATSQPLLTNATPEVDSHNGSWQNYSNQFPVAVGTRFVQYTMNFYLHAGGDLDAFVDDNYLALVQSVSAPALQIALAGTNVLISWPAPSTGFALQTNSVLGTTNWVNCTDAVALIGTNNVVTNSSALGANFYRLLYQ